MLDLKPATDALAAIAAAVADDQLTLPTPCEKATVADLLDHVDGLSTGFTMAAQKQIPEGGSSPPRADGSRLGDEWRRADHREARSPCRGVVRPGSRGAA